VVLHTACGSGGFCSAGDKLGRLRGANGTCGGSRCDDAAAVTVAVVW
jgi:hypothetical protein